MPNAEPLDDLTPRSPAARGPLGFALIVALLFAVLVTIGLAHHEFWRDEAKAWLIARDSTSLLDLLHNRRYEGHPIAWYVPLWIVSRFTRNPAAMQVVHGLIATAVVFIFAWRSPFSRLQKALFALGVFPLYEYAVVSRGYGLGVLALFVLLSLFNASKQRPILVALVVVVLANTSMYGLLIAMTYMAAWGSQPKTSLNAAAAFIVIIAVVLAMWQIIPPPPIHAPAGATLIDSLSDERFTGLAFPRAIGTAWRAYVPIPRLSTGPGAQVFYTNVLDRGTPITRTLIALASVVLIITASALLRRAKPALLFYLAGTGLILAFTWLRFPGSLRHHGHLFIVLLGAIWIALPTIPAQSNKYLSRFITALLAIHAAAGIYYFARDLREPFAPSRAAAALLTERYGGNFDLVADPGNFGSPVCAYLDKPIYFPVREAFGSYELLDGTPKRATPVQLANALRTLATGAKRPIILLSATPIDETMDGLTLIHLVSYPPGLSGERYDLYEVRTAAAP